MYTASESFFALTIKGKFANWQISKFQYYLIMLSESLYVHIRETYWQNFSQKCRQISKIPTITVILNVEQFNETQMRQSIKKFLSHSFHIPQFLPCNMMCLKCFVDTSFHGHLPLSKLENGKFL